MPLGAGSDCQRQRDRQSGEAVCEVQQEAQRRFIRPVGIVDGEHQRAALGHVDDKPVQAVQRRECEIARFLRSQTRR